MKQNIKRIEYLKHIGISEPLIQMAQGEILHPFFESAYQKPNDIDIPEEITPLWELDDFKTLVLEKNSELVFIQVNSEDPEATYSVIGFTEQAPLARLFLDIIETSSIENNVLIRQVKEASECSGFKYCEEFISLLQLYDEDEGQFQKRFELFQKRTDW